MSSISEPGMASGASRRRAWAPPASWPRTSIPSARSRTDANFEFAKRLRGSRVEYKEVSVYDLDSLEQQFDVVVFFGVLYHLRYPNWASRGSETS